MKAYVRFHLDTATRTLLGVLIQPYDQTEENFTLLQAFARNIYGTDGERALKGGDGRATYSEWVYPTTTVLVSLVPSADHVSLWYCPEIPVRSARKY